MTLRLSEMPTSFAGEAMMWAASKTWLSPSRNWTPHAALNHSLIRRVFENTVTRFIALQVYAVGAAVVCGIPGAVWHGAQAVRHQISAIRNPAQRERLRAFSYEHAKAGFIDITALFRAAVYPFWTSDSTRYENYIHWWFSNTEVQTEYAGPRLRYRGIDSQDRFVAEKVCCVWGHGSHVSSRRAPLSCLKQIVVEQWAREGRVYPSNHPAVLRKLIVDTFDAAADRMSWNKRDNQPFYLSRGGISAFAPTHCPEYGIPWRSIAWVVAGLAAIAFVALALISFPTVFALIEYFIASPVPSNVHLFAEIIHVVVMSIMANLVVWLYLVGVFFSTASITWSFDNARKSYIASRIAAEQNLINRLATTPSGDQPNADIKRFQEVLFWLKRSAHRGHIASQKKYGLALLASLAHRENARKMTDSEVLVAREGISWLQAAMMNMRRLGNRRFVHGVLGIRWKDVRRGYSGKTEVEQSRSLLRRIRFAPVVQALARRYPESSEIPEKMKQAFIALRDAENKVRQTEIQREISAARTPLIPDLEGVVAGYAV